MKTLPSLLLALTASVCAFGADPATLKLIPADSAFLAGVRADQVRTSRFGQFILDQLKSEQANLQKFIDSTGFDPRRDLTELVVASNDAKGHGAAVVIAKGTFDRSRIESFARSEGAIITTYNGATLFSHPEGRDGQGAIALVDSSIAVAGNPAAVRAAIDRYRSAGGPVLDGAALNRIADLSTRYDAWMMTTSLARIADDMRSPQVSGTMQSDLMKSMQSVMGGVRFGPSVEIAAEAAMRSEKDATAMVDVVRFLAGMIQMHGEQDPKAKDLVTLLDKMQLSAQGTTFRMSLSIPEDQLEQILKTSTKVRKGERTPVF